MFHRDPSQRSANASVAPTTALPPIAKQLFGPGHAMAFKLAPFSFGLATTDQRIPFHRSTSAFNPTARQVFALGHEMSLRAPPAPPDSLGLVNRDQVLPFQCSTKPVRILDAFVKLPTAKQLVVLGHAAPVQALAFAPEGFGEFMRTQRVPSQRPINLCSVHALWAAE
jgi:hypothetical protein